MVEPNILFSIMCLDLFFKIFKYKFDKLLRTDAVTADIIHVITSVMCLTSWNKPHITTTHPKKTPTIHNIFHFSGSGMLVPTFSSIERILPGRKNPI